MTDIEITTSSNAFEDLGVDYKAAPFMTAYCKAGAYSPPCAGSIWHSERVEDVVQSALDRAASLRSQLEEAREIMKPFEKWLSVIEDFFGASRPDDDSNIPTIMSPSSDNAKMANLRQIREFLAKTEPK